MPPGLLVPRCCWRCWCCCLRPWDDRQFHCFQYLLSHRLHHCRGQPGSQVPLTMLGVVGFTGATCEGQGARIMVISLPEEMGLQGLLLLLPSYLWIWVLESCALPPLLLWGSLGLPWLRARISGTTSTVPSFLSPLCILVHPPLHIQMCGTLWHPVVLVGRGTFVELWMFYWLYIGRWRQREHLTLPPCCCHSLFNAFLIHFPLFICLLYFSIFIFPFYLFYLLFISLCKNVLVFCLGFTICIWNNLSAPLNNIALLHV